MQRSRLLVAGLFGAAALALAAIGGAASPQRAQADQGCSGIPFAIPCTPTDVHFGAAAGDSHSLVLHWHNPAPLDEFMELDLTQNGTPIDVEPHVTNGQNGNFYYHVTDTLPNTSGYIFLSNLNLGTTYCARVRGYYALVGFGVPGGLSSDWSNGDCMTTDYPDLSQYVQPQVCRAPLNLTATVNSGGVLLSWDMPANALPTGFLWFIVERSDGMGPWKAIGPQYGISSHAGSQYSYEDTTATTPLASYKYRIDVYTRDGDVFNTLSCGNVVSVTVPSKTMIPFTGGVGTSLPPLRIIPPGH